MGRNGSIHTIVLVLVMLIGFGAALGWPQYEKHRTIAAAQKALDIGKSLAFAELLIKSIIKPIRRILNCWAQTCLVRWNARTEKRKWYAVIIPFRLRREIWCV